MSRQIIIATRESPLALWQSNFVKSELKKIAPELDIVLLGITTIGDRFLDKPLSEIGGKGLFVKELEKALLENQADIAVHSMKDMPMELPEGLQLGAILKRANPFDAFVSIKYKNLNELPKNAIVGTSSLRRQSQLRWLRPDLEIKPLRGNVQTRLKKLEEGHYHAIVLASAGLERLGLASYITQQLTLNEMCPATGQGAIGIECRCDDAILNKLVGQLNERCTFLAVMAERALNQALGGSCHFPIASYAVCDNQNIKMTARVGSKNGDQLLEESDSVVLHSKLNTLEGELGRECGELAHLEHAITLGLNIANRLKAKGAEQLIHG